MQSKRTLCSALIQCYFDYAWYSGIDKKLQLRLQVTQNKVVRFILNLGPRTSISCEILDSLGMLRVDDRATQLRLNHVFNIFHGNAPNYLCDKFILNKNNTRGATNNNYVIPKIKGKESSCFYYNAIKDWNTLPLDTKQLSSKQSLKKTCKVVFSQQGKGSFMMPYPVLLILILLN